MATPKMKSDGRTITVRVPISIRKRGGRKVVLTPDGAAGDARKLFCHQVDNAMVKGLARAFRWRELLENGSYSTIKEIAEAEKIAETYVGRVLRLSLLAPDIVEAMLAGRQAPQTTLPLLMRPFSIGMEQAAQAPSAPNIHWANLSWCCGSPSGLWVMLLGTFLVQAGGFSNVCSDEITAKAVEYGPMVLGGIMAWIGATASAASRDMARANNFWVSAHGGSAADVIFPSSWRRSIIAERLIFL